MKTNNIKYCKNRENVILPLCKNKNVLHLGCADSFQLERKLNTKNFLHGLIENEANILHGVDNNKNAVKIMNASGYNNIFVDNVEILECKDLLRYYDVVVAAEIIEHLSNPGLMVDAVRNKLSDNGILAITTPNPISLRFFIHYFLGEEISSPFHSIAFTFTTISNFLNRHNYSIESMYGTQPTGHNSFRHKIIRPLFDVILKGLPKYGDDMVILAKKNI